MTNGAGKQDDAIRVYLILSHWLLAPIRDTGALDAMPRDEAAECRALWGEMGALRSRAEKMADQINVQLSPHTRASSKGNPVSGSILRRTGLG